MLADINLLPQRERRNIMLWIIVPLIILLLMAINGYIYYQYHIVQKKLAIEEGLLQNLVQLREMEEQKLNSLNNSSAAQDLEKIIQWVETVPIPTVLLIQHLNSLLPEQGYLLSFSYTEQGKIQSSIQFSTILEAASYLHQLSKSEVLDQVWLNNVTTETSSTGENQSILPRYEGQFDLVIQPEVVKSLKGAE